jgi:hypothetical protein
MSSVSVSASALPPVLDGVMLEGRVNTSDEAVLANVQHSIRLGYQQCQPQNPQPNRIALVAGGPSLADTEQELADLLLDPSIKLVTVNGSYRWCVERHFRPSAHILIDARPCNARFLDPPVPECRYYLASQCHPDTWAAVVGRPHVGIFHGCGGSNEVLKPVLDAYYLQRWHAVTGGSTVTTRALGLLRMLGYLRFDLFGVDSCWLGDQSHAYPQPENADDPRTVLWAHPTGHPEMGRRFVCSPWHVMQIEDFMKWMRTGLPFSLSVHGDGLLAYVLQAAAEIQLTEEQDMQAVIPA